MKPILLMSAWICTLIISMVAIAEPELRTPSNKFKVSAPVPELLSFAYELQDYLNARDTDFVQRQFNWASFTARQQRLLLQNLPANLKDPLRLKTLLVAVTGSQKSFSNNFAKYFEQGDSWEYLYHRNAGASHYLLFRYDTDDSFNYFEMEVVYSDHHWWLFDWYNHATETWITQAFSDLISLQLSDSLNAGQGDTSVQQFVHTSDASIIQAYDKLAAPMQRQHLLQSLLVSRAFAIDNATYAQAVERILAQPEQDAFSFYKLGYFLGQSNFDSALAYANRLERRVGRDYQLQLLQADILNRLGRHKQADRLLAKMIKHNAKNDAVFYALLILLIDQQRFQEAVLVLDVLKQDFGVLISAETLAGVEGMSALLNSEAFQRWQAANRA